MTHLKLLSDSSFSFTTWVHYYVMTFCKRLDILLPFSILIATIRCLSNMQQKSELVSMLSSGISKTQLMKPFIICCLAFSSILLLNYQWVLPSALTDINQIRASSFGEEDIEDLQSPLSQVLLTDASKIVYKGYNKNLKQFQDVFWIKNPNTVYHIKVLDISESVPVGHFVDKISRDKNKGFHKVDSKVVVQFDEIQFDDDSLKNSTITPMEQSLSQLIGELILYAKGKSNRYNEIKATLYYKLTFPLFCLVAFLGPAARLLRYGRVIPLLMIYLVSIAALFCLNLFFQALFILAKSELIAPSIAILLPWTIILFTSQEGMCFHNSSYLQYR